MDAHAIAIQLGQFRSAEDVHQNEAFTWIMNYYIPMVSHCYSSNSCSPQDVPSFESAMETFASPVLAPETRAHIGELLIKAGTGKTHVQHSGKWAGRAAHTELVNAGNLIVSADEDSMAIKSCLDYYQKHAGSDGNLLTPALTKATDWLTTVFAQAIEIGKDEDLAVCIKCAVDEDASLLSGDVDSDQVVEHATAMIAHLGCARSDTPVSDLALGKVSPLFSFTGPCNHIALQAGLHLLRATQECFVNEEENAPVSFESMFECRGNPSYGNKRKKAKSEAECTKIYKELIARMTDIVASMKQGEEARYDRMVEETRRDAEIAREVETLRISQKELAEKFALVTDSMSTLRRELEKVTELAELYKKASEPTQSSQAPSAPFVIPPPPPPPPPPSLKATTVIDDARAAGAKSRLVVDQARESFKKTIKTMEKSEQDISGNIQTRAGNPLQDTQGLIDQKKKLVRVEQVAKQLPSGSNSIMEALKKALDARREQTKDENTAEEETADEEWAILLPHQISQALIAGHQRDRGRGASTIRNKEIYVKARLSSVDKILATVDLGTYGKVEVWLDAFQMQDGRYSLHRDKVRAYFKVITQPSLNERETHRLAVGTPENPDYSTSFVQMGRVFRLSAHHKDINGTKADTVMTVLMKIIY